MNFKFKVDDINVQATHNNTPADVSIKGIEVEVTDVSLRDIPVVLSSFKDLVSQLDNESFQREIIRDDRFLHQVERGTSQTQFVAISPR